MGEQGFLHRRGEAVTVDGQRTACRQLVPVGRPHDQRAGAPHFLVQEADGIVLRIVGAEGIGADEFGQAVGEMGFGAAHRPHLVQHDGNAGGHKLPGRFAACEPATDDMNALDA